MPATRPPYPPEFRCEAVRLLRESGRPKSQIARELGITPWTLRLWEKQAEIDAGEREGLTKSAKSRAVCAARCGSSRRSGRS